MRLASIFKMTLVVLLSAVFATQSFAISDEKKKAIAERIKPVGEVCIEGDSNCATATVAASSGPRSGEEIYNSKCLACHASGAAGAPKLGDVAGWAPRIAAGKLYENAINGINGMPAKGLCMDCSDDEIKVAVDYMVEKSK